MNFLMNMRMRDKSLPEKCKQSVDTSEHRIIYSANHLWLSNPLTGYFFRQEGSLSNNDSSETRVQI